MKLRCRMDGLIVPARVEASRLLAWDGEESFEMGKMEASFYEIVEELIGNRRQLGVSKFTFATRLAPSHEIIAAWDDK